MNKHEKALSKIWKKFDPDKNDSELKSFICYYHPSVIEIKRQIDQAEKRILVGIKNQDPNKRTSTIEDAIYRSWAYYMKHDGQDFLFRESCDGYLCRWVYGIEIGEENWTGKSTFEFDEEDLDELWNNIWERNTEEGFWGEEEIKKMIWEDGYGLRRNILRSIKDIQEMITPEMKKEIEKRKSKTDTCYEVFRPLREKFELDDEAGKMDDWTSVQRREARPVFRHDRSDHIKTTWNVQYICEDLWGGLDHEAIYEKVRKEQEED